MVCQKEDENKEKKVLLKMYLSNGEGKAQGI